MSPEQFRKLKNVKQIDVLFDQGIELMSRIFIFYNIKLYALHDFFVEVWYMQTTNRIDRIIVLTTEEVMEIYEKKIRLDDLI